MHGLRLSLTLALALLLSSSVASAGSARDGDVQLGTVPVASLEPAKTEALWSRLASTGPARSQQGAECRPLRAVFWAASDWLRLATKLAERASPCAEYFVSVPPLVADKTQPRPNQAARIRALGRNVHALAEIHFATWSRWVASTGTSWHAAGVTARQRMATAGYDVAQGDGWVLNELTSAVRRGTGNARANVREFLRGLYEGDGTRPTKGAVLVIGVGQRTGDLSVYQNTLQSWLTDADFWTEVGAYVSDWSQQVYGDVRSHAVPGTPQEVRRDYLNDYLRHPLVLANAGPPEIEPARAFLRSTYGALANAAWQRESSYGWTMVPGEQMAAYVSAQVDALRWFSGSAGQARDQWGFVWAPRNSTGMPATDFAAQTSRVLERLATAIRDSALADPESRSSGACGPVGQETLCAADVEGARHNEGWRSFRAWTQPLLRLALPAQTLVAGTPSPPIGLSLVTSSGAALATPATVAVTLRSTAPQGTFSTSPAGPWTSTLTVSTGAGPTLFHYQSTRAGRDALTAAGAGATTGTQHLTVVAGPVASVSVAPPSGQLRARGLRRFAATPRDAYGNVATAPLAWGVAPAALGTFEAPRGGTIAFRAARLLGTGTITATVATPAGPLAGSASVTVTPARLRIGSIAFRPGKRGVRVLLAAVDGARKPVAKAALTVVVQRDGVRLLSARARTGAAGRTLVRAPGRGCFTVLVRRAVAPGFTWDGRTPRNRFCRR